MMFPVYAFVNDPPAHFPQLKRVIVATGDKVVMEPTLDESLSALFGTSPGQSSQAAQTSGTQGLLPKAVLDQARAQLAEAQKAINLLKGLLATPAR
jgi:uncharacterized membrane protein (UPF0182 family)